MRIEKSCTKIQGNCLTTYTAQENYTHIPKIKAVKTNIDFGLSYSDIIGSTHKKYDYGYGYE